MIQKIDDSPPFFFNLVVILIRLGILKRRVHKQKPTTTEELKAMIKKIINEISNDDLKKAVENLVLQLHALLHDSGEHFEHLT